jgi:hypothetical protein
MTAKSSAVGTGTALACLGRAATAGSGAAAVWGTEADTAILSVKGTTGRIAESFAGKNHAGAVMEERCRGRRICG